MSAVYIHIPFCKRRCYYCDFITYANKDDMLPDYLEALQAEILSSPFNLGEAESIYIGGGTPSLMSSEQVYAVLQTIQKRFGIALGAEITLEVNPGTVKNNYYAQLKAVGINRLSMGLQSFVDEELQVLGRIHTAEEAKFSFFAARKAKFENISLDLIFGLPGQTMTSWRKNLKAIEALKPDHLSIYSLILEPGTPLTKQIERGIVQLPDDDLVADMFEETMDYLDGIGYEHYEISSWAIDERKESWHNKVYWKARDYLGFGVSAVSYVDGERWQNPLQVEEYILKITESARRHNEKRLLNELGYSGISSKNSQSIVLERESISSREQMNEMMFLGLRMTREGVSEFSFRQRFGLEMAKVYEKEINRLINLGLVQWIGEDQNRRLILTRRGCMLGNQVFMEFV